MQDDATPLTVYVETTIPSYLSARPSRDLLTAAHQQVTHDWWATARERYRMVISEAVIDEIGAGDPTYASRRIELVADLETLDFTDDVAELIRTYDRRLGLSGVARADVVHFAFAVAYHVDYLVTWNCAHIANGHVIRRLLKINDDLQRSTPVIVTPIELMPAPSGDEP